VPVVARFGGEKMKTRLLDTLFDPQTVAVIGASNTKGSVGHRLLRNLIAAEYEGTVYPVSRRRRSVHGIQAFPSVGHVPGKVDLAVIAVPAISVPDVLRDCGEGGVGAAVIVSSGFKETGEAGAALEKQIVAIAHTYGLRVLGPNCLGFLRPGRNLNATFASVLPKPGRICFISQSGAVGSAVLDWATSNDVGFSAFISVGSMCDVDFGDLIDYFGADAQTNSIILHLESLPDARKFMRAARHFARTKPIVVVKSGRNARAALAVACHTGCDAGDDVLYSAALRRAGVVRVDRVDNLFTSAEALSRIPSPRGPRLGIVTSAGGPGVMAVDRLLELGGELAELSPETDAALQACLPAYATRSNPVDVGDDADAARFAAATRVLMDDMDCDGVLAIFTSHAMTHPTETAAALVDVSREHPRKPLLAALMGGGMVAQGLQQLHGAHVPAFQAPEDAVSAYMYMHEYTRSLATLYETPTDILPDFQPDREMVKGIFAVVARQDRTTLNEVESKEVLDAYGIPVIDTLVATSPAECSRAARQVGLPVTIKILSPDLPEKFVVGGVALDVRSSTEAGKQFNKIVARVRHAAPNAELQGVAVHAMSRGAYNLVLSSWRDGTFGPAILFGRYDRGVDVYSDVAVGFPPLNQALARSLISDTRLSRLLQGERGRQAIDTEALEEALVKFSYLLVDFPEIVEMEVGPLQVRADGVQALDAHIVIDPKDVHSMARHGSHLMISAYPSKYSSTEAVGGKQVEIRAIRPEDEPLWAEMITSLSEQSSEYRFFGPVTKITKPMLTRYCHIDYDSEIAIVAITGEAPRHMLGAASFTVDTPGGLEAEFAVLVRDSAQHQGLGRRLMKVLIDAARDHYVREIRGTILAANAPMLAFVEHLGFDVRPADDPELRTAVLRV
jgi:acetyltransferase